jgi:aspartate aminotransferase
MKLARRVMELNESATLAVSAKAARMKAEGIDVIGFGAGELDFPTPDHIKQACFAAIQANQTGYSKPTTGLVAARKAVCDKLARVNKLTYSPEQVMIEAGGKMCVYVAVHAVVDPGDEVVIPAPYWVSYPEIVRLAGGIPVIVSGREERDYKLTPEELGAAITPKTRLIMYNSPSNPSGVTYDPDEVKALCRVIEGRDIWLLSDEIYDGLLFGDQQTLSPAAVSEKMYARTITLNSASKTYAMTGWRVGYMAGPVEVIQAMAKLQSQSTSGAVTFNQLALAEALNGDHAPIHAMRRELEQRRNHMYGRLSSMPGVRCPKPTGAFYCFPNVSAHYERLGVSGSGEFAERLLDEARVAVVPGEAFGMDGHIRLSFALGMEQMDEGLSRMEQFLSGG